MSVLPQRVRHRLRPAARPALVDAGVVEAADIAAEGAVRLAELAKGIAAEQSGYDAFMHWVAQGNMSRVKQRIRAVATRSGARLFEFDPTKGYRHGWWTLEQLGEMEGGLAPGDASPLSGRPFVPWR